MIRNRKIGLFLATMLVANNMIGSGIFLLPATLAEVGSITPLPQPGNPKPRLFRLEADRALINRLGFNSAGHASAVSRLRSRGGRPGIIGVNIGANKESSDIVADYVQGLSCFNDIASYIAINISSPNTPGLTHEPNNNNGAALP